MMPVTHYRLGNMFFGEVPKLYNLQLAQYFFTYAAYPIIGDVPEFAHYQLSRVLFIEGSFDASLREAQRELEAFPENKRTYYILGLTYGYMSREAEAIESFSKFIEAYPESWAARNDKAWLQFRIGDLDGAIATMFPIKDHRNAWVQNTYGTLLLNKGELDEAKQAFLLAQEVVSSLSEESWGSAYPGNDPRVYAAGLSAMRQSIADNLTLLESKDISTQESL